MQGFSFMSDLLFRQCLLTPIETLDRRLQVEGACAGRVHTSHYLGRNQSKRTCTGECARLRQAAPHLFGHYAVSCGAPRPQRASAGLMGLTGKLLSFDIRR